MENNTWQIDEDLYKVHISAGVFEELVKEMTDEDLKLEKISKN